ncbi:uncharacterized protein LOC132611003 [Lycium barbarum]|uniref:uncharacterized protein LOC132611003 n=1 Tax=Lycium barbarum TaxID=112863 RepID=UPI00293E9747|nr:uncharacterized protein LOC132611003 [Lycium barbarum]
MGREIRRIASFGVRLDETEDGELVGITPSQSDIVERIKSKQYEDGLLRQELLVEAYSYEYSVHLVSTEMYKDLKQHYWWKSIKVDISNFVANWLNCQQIDGQAERNIQTLEDMLRACAIDFDGNWDEHLPLVEFTYNNSYQPSIQKASYEALYGRHCRCPIGWFDPIEVELLGPDSVRQAIKKVNLIVQ